jgi:hypothetical protein
LSRAMILTSKNMFSPITDKIVNQKPERTVEGPA